MSDEGKTSTKSKESSMPVVVVRRPQNNAPAESGVNQSEGLKASLEILREGVSDSMNYADNCMSELLTRMEGMFANEPDTGIKAYDPDRVNSAALCARTVAELIKAKTEAMRLLKTDE